MSDKKSNKIKLQILFLTYGDKYKESFDILYSFLKDLNKTCDITINTIDNNIEEFTPRFRNAHIELTGDNSSFEFSGWDKGIKYLKQSKVNYDVCLLVNDSFVTNSYFLNKKLLSIETINKCLRNNALVGKIDRLDRLEEYKGLDYSIDNKDVTSWVRTNCFYMTKEMVDSLDTLVTIKKEDLNKFVSQEYHGRCFLHNAEISINLQLQMIAYFTKYWHSKREINAESWDTWRMKVYTMCLEKMLYVVIKEKGYNIYDYSEFHYDGDFNMRNRILIATDIPFLHLMKGNTNRIKSYYNCLKKQYNVDILFFQEKEQNNSVFGENIYYYSDFLPFKPKSVKIEQPYNISSKVKYEYKLAFDEFINIAELDYDYIIIPYIWMSYLIDVKPKTNAKFIIDTHDSFSERTKSLASQGIRFTSACTVEDEKFCLRNFDYIMAISDEEKAVFESMGYNNVFTSKYFYKNKANLQKLGIIGSSSVHNIDALDWFVNNIFKGNLDNEYQLYVCGELAKDEKILAKYKGLKNIIFYGIIWNIEDFYNLIDICINPVQIGSGLKIKNIEAISFNKPIITSTVGIQGMEEELNKGLIFKADNLTEWKNTLKYMSYGPNLDKLRERQIEYNLNNTDLKVYNNLINIIENS